LLAWFALVELAVLGGGWLARRGLRGGSAVGLRAGWFAGAAPCVLGALFLAWYLGLTRVLGG
jgi:hypothetical protein